MGTARPFLTGKQDKLGRETRWAGPPADEVQSCATGLDAALDADLDEESGPLTKVWRMVEGTDPYPKDCRVVVSHGTRESESYGRVVSDAGDTVVVRVDETDREVPRFQVSPAGLGVLEETGGQELDSLDSQVAAAKERSVNAQAELDGHWGDQLAEGSNAQELAAQVRAAAQLGMMTEDGTLDPPTELLVVLLEGWDHAESANNRAAEDVENLLGAKELLDGGYVQLV